MPYVEGESLRGRLARERQLPVEDAVRIARVVAGALDYAHRKGVLHRDLKPENIHLDEDGHAVVADFGIARAVARAADADTLTSTGVTLGTPAYMSPEQAAGERDLDARTDIYSLGCVLYEMLAGAPPFTAPTAQALIARVVTDEPRPLAQLRRAVPGHIEAAVERSLQKLPADRFATAAQFGAALGAPEPATASGPADRWAPTRGGRGVRATRREAAWAMLGLALGTALAGLLFGAARSRAGRLHAGSPRRSGSRCRSPTVSGWSAP
jgi:serine/threonine-protein kinase